MKTLQRSTSILIIALFGCFVLSSFGKSEGEKGRIKVYIVNKCSSDVQFRVKCPGSATKYTAYDACKKPMSFMEGTKIYNTNGEMVLEVNASSENAEVIVCE